jgi:hypothetical protein
MHYFPNAFLEILQLSLAFTLFNANNSYYVYSKRQYAKPFQNVICEISFNRKELSGKEKLGTSEQKKIK